MMADRTERTVVIDPVEQAAHGFRTQLYIWETDEQMVAHEANAISAFYARLRANGVPSLLAHRLTLTFGRARWGDGEAVECEVD